jgi:hypothetical protein
MKIYAASDSPTAACCRDKGVNRPNQQLCG